LEALGDVPDIFALSAAGNIPMPRASQTGRTSDVRSMNSGDRTEAGKG